MYIIIHVERECWNRQTGTFEVRVSTTYGFKSHLAHQVDPEGDLLSGSFFSEGV